MNFDADYGRMYDYIVEHSIPGYEHLFLMARGYLESRLPDRAEILVVGAGGGREIVTFGDHSAWAFVGVDPAEQMIAFARHKIEQAGLNARARLHVGYTRDLPADPTFDAATCILVLHFLADDAKLALLNEIAARMKPGAPLVVAGVFGEGFVPDELKAWQIFLRERGMSPEAIDAQTGRARETTRFAPESRLLEMLDAAGFEEARRFYTAFWFSGWVAQKKSG